MPLEKVTVEIKTPRNPLSTFALSRWWISTITLPNRDYLYNIHLYVHVFRSQFAKNFILFMCNTCLYVHRYPIFSVCNSRYVQRTIFSIWFKIKNTMYLEWFIVVSSTEFGFICSCHFFRPLFLCFLKLTNTLVGNDIRCKVVRRSKIR